MRRTADMRGRFLALLRFVVLISCFVTPARAVTAGGDHVAAVNTVASGSGGNAAADLGAQAGGADLHPSSDAAFAIRSNNQPERGYNLAPDESQCALCNAVVKTSYLHLHQDRNTFCNGRAAAKARSAATAAGQRAAREAAAAESARRRGMARQLDEDARQAATASGLFADDLPLPDDHSELTAEQQKVLEAARLKAAEEKFDSTAELVKFITHLGNNAGMREDDINELLRIIKHPLFDPTSVKLRNADDVREYQQELRPEDVSIQQLSNSATTSFF